MRKNKNVRIIYALLSTYGLSYTPANAIAEDTKADQKQETIINCPNTLAGIKLKYTTKYRPPAVGDTLTCDLKK